MRTSQWVPVLLAASMSGACDRQTETEHPETTPSPAAPAGEGDESALAPEEYDVAAIDDWLAAQVDAGDFVGLSVGIMRGGEVVLARGYGKRSIEDDAPVEPDTRFAIASVSKQFTCATALRLQEKGKLKLSQKVAEYYPKATQAGDITLLDTLNHVAGYPDYYPLDFVVPSMAEQVEVEQVVNDYASRELDFPPRARFSYSNTGYLLVGRVIERVTKKSLAEVMSAELFEPLALEHTMLGAGPVPEGAATGYFSFALGDPEPAPREGKGWLHAAGGLWSTAPDLLRWDLALMDGKVLEESSFELMTTQPTLTDGRLSSYGCGLGVSRRRGEQILRHGGAVNGYLTQNVMIPGTRSAVVVITNDYSSNPGRVADVLVRLLLDADGKMSDAPEVDGPPPREIALELLHQMQAGQVDPTLLSEDFRTYLTPERAAAAARRLKALGEPLSVEAGRPSERGGMEVSRITFVFESRSVNAMLYRTADGIVHEFILMR